MGTILLTLELLVAALALVAAAAASLRIGRSTAFHAVVVALCSLPFAGLLALALWVVFRLRVQLGVTHAPLELACLAAVAFCGAASWLGARTRPGAPIFGWRPARLWLIALFAGVLAATTARALDLQARLGVAHLGSLAGRIALRVRPPAPSTVDNAAPRYLALAASLGDEAPALAELLEGRQRLDPQRSDVVAASARLAPLLPQLVQATDLSHCVFESPSNDDAAIVDAPSVLPLLQLARHLALESLVRAAGDDPRMALRLARAQAALAAHVEQSPLLITLAAAAAVRTQACQSLAHALSSERLTLAALSAADPWPAPGDVAASALDAERAFGLALLAGLPDSSASMGGLGGRLGPLAASAYAIFMLERDALGYQTMMAEGRSLVELSTPELCAAARNSALRSSNDLARHGLFARYFAVHLADLLVMSRRAQALGELGPAAVAAARHKLEHGAYPLAPGEWCAAFDGLRVEGDGSWIELSSARTREFDEPPLLRLPVLRPQAARER